MARTNSLAFPNMFDVASNKVSVLSDNVSVINRTRLLMMTEPTELYNNIDFGVGLKRHLWKYNTENEVAIIKDRITDQLRLHEPSVDAEETAFAGGLVDQDVHFLEPASFNEYNKLNMTVGLSTIFGDSLNIELDKKTMEKELYNNGRYTIDGDGNKQYE